MKAYAQEIEDGIQDLIENNCTIAYCSPIDLEITDEEKAIALSHADARDKDDEQVDLYYLSSVLVSSGWNKNDDVLIPKKCGRHAQLPKINNLIICTTKKISLAILQEIMWSILVVNL